MSIKSITERMADSTSKLAPHDPEIPGLVVMLELLDRLAVMRFIHPEAN